MPVPDTYNDGSFDVGTLQVSIDTRDFIAEDIRPTKGSREALVYGADHLPAGAVQWRDFERISCTLVGETGVAAPDVNEEMAYGGVTYVITKADKAVAQGAVDKYSVEGRRKVNVA